MARPPADHRSEILDAAKRLLERGAGVEGLTAQAIAREAKLSRATLYRQYPSVDDVLLDLSQFYEELAVERLTGLLTIGDPSLEATAAAIVDAVMTAVHELSALTRAVRREELAAGSEAERRRLERIGRQRQMLKLAITAIYGRAPSDEILTALMILVHDGAIHAVIEAERRDDAQILERYRAAITTVLIVTLRDALAL